MIITITIIIFSVRRSGLFIALARSVFQHGRALLMLQHERDAVGLLYRGHPRLRRLHTSLSSENLSKKFRGRQEEDQHDGEAGTLLPAHVPPFCQLTILNSTN